MNRKLATIEKIDRIFPHPNADSLELAQIRGWQVCIKKGEFQEKPIGCPPGLCVYVEIDSVLPERPEFEFLRERKFRVRTIKLRQELSQGIAFPLSILPDGTEWIEGLDVTELLGITLYQPPIPACLGGDVVGKFPSLIPKTDCERIQNHAWIFDELADIEWGVTEKLDGSSCSVWWKDGELHVCSRNWELKPSESNAFWQAVNREKMEDKLCGMPIALQGEIVGPKIQGNAYKINKPTLFFFDAYDFQKKRYLDFLEFRGVCDHLDLEVVPLISCRTRLKSIASILAEADSDSQLRSGCPREGLVWRPLYERHDPRIGRVAFKAISNQFLLKAKD